MSALRTPQGQEWNDVVEVLHRLSNVMTSRLHYPEGHPAIQRAALQAQEGFQRVLASVPELVVALADGEFLICDRPMPDLRTNLAALAAAMERHEIECMVFMRGLELGECEALGRSLALSGDLAGRVRETAQASLAHVLLRFVDIRTRDKAFADEVQAASFLPTVQQALDSVLNAFAHETLADVTELRALARRIVAACSGRTYTLLTRCYVPGADDQAAHATNVAMMTASLAMAARVADEQVVEITAAALLHDIGTLLSPAAIRGLPEPVLDEPQRGVFRHHPVTGGWALLSTGCPPMWIAVALEHHRGLDRRGYPALDSPDAPDELVRTVSLASFFDRKRTLLDGRVDSPDETLRQASRLEAGYFGPPLVTRFLRTFGVYPPGTMVELSDGQAALVTHASPHDPLRPQVRLLTGKAAGRQVDLKHRNLVEGRHDLSIARAILAPLARRDPHEQEAEAIIEDVPMHAEAVVEDEAQLLARLGGPAAVPVLATTDLSGTPLDHRQGYLLTFIDGVSSLEQLLEMTGLPGREVLELIESLVRIGAIHVGRT